MIFVNTFLEKLLTVKIYSQKVGKIFIGGIMTLKKGIDVYLKEKKELQKSLLKYFENIEDDNDDYLYCILLLDDQNILNDRQDLKDYLILLLNITNNFHRPPNIYQKIDRIFQQLHKAVKEFFSNKELFSIFKSSKIILLYLIEEKYINIDKSIFNIISKDKYKKRDYLSFFYYEIQSFLSPALKQEIEKRLAEQKVELDPFDFDSFNKKRKIGENHSIVANFIRNDSIEDFIAYFNQFNISLRSLIAPSLFETNSFLINKKPTLIEYAAFFGSIQTFKYLNYNHIDLTQSLWIYSIHSHCSELIHLLEESKILPKDSSFEECLIESIKCHFVDLTFYFLDNLLTKNDKEKELIFSNESLKYSNYSCFPSDLYDDIDLFNLVNYNYNSIVEFILGTSNININYKLILFKKNS